MKKSDVQSVKEECQRLLAKIEMMEINVPLSGEYYQYGYGKHTASVKRASMDLTRALSRMRGR